MNAPSQRPVSSEAEDAWTVAGRTFHSRLIIGTGKYRDYALNAAAAEASGAQIVTVALRRVNLSDPSQPMLVDAGVGTPSDAVLAMELGCEAVLTNTAIAGAKDPIRMARAMKHAVIAGREGYLAGRMAKRMYADPSSPLAGLI